MAAGTTTGMTRSRRKVLPANRSTMLAGTSGLSRKISSMGVIRKITGSTVMVPMMKRFLSSTRNSLRTTAPRRPASNFMAAPPPGPRR
jgi:hypothetical protein